jgi:hypothetical protein
VPVVIICTLQLVGKFFEDFALPVYLRSFAISNSDNVIRKNPLVDSLVILSPAGQQLERDFAPDYLEERQDCSGCRRNNFVRQERWQHLDRSAKEGRGV